MKYYPYFCTCIKKIVIMKVEENRFTIKEYKRGGSGYTTLTYDNEKVRILCLNAKRDKNIIALVTNKDGKEELRDYSSLMGAVNGLKLVEYIYENGDFVTTTDKNGKYVRIVKSYNDYTGHISHYHCSYLMDEDEKTDEEVVRLSTYEEREFLKNKLSFGGKEWNYNDKEVHYSYDYTPSCHTGMSIPYEEDEDYSEYYLEKREKEKEDKYFERLAREEKYRW